jgi:hypothetical protein
MVVTVAASCRLVEHSMVAGAKSDASFVSARIAALDVAGALAVERITLALVSSVVFDGVGLVAAHVVIETGASTTSTYALASGSGCFHIYVGNRCGTESIAAGTLGIGIGYQSVAAGRSSWVIRFFG